MKSCRRLSEYSEFILEIDGEAQNQAFLFLGGGGGRYMKSSRGAQRARKIMFQSQ
jgi:hypothetical protein